MNKNVTIPIKGEHGVLQVDLCSPLLFNKWTNLGIVN